MQPEAILGLVLLAALGLLVGSVLDAVVSRVPAGARVVSVLRPQCECGEPRHGLGLVPVLWLVGSVRVCPSCGRAAGWRRFLLEVLCAAAYVALGLVLGLSWELPAYLYLAALGLALTAIDLATQRLPNALTLPAYPIVGGLLLLPTVIEGLCSDYGRAALGGVALFSLYLLLAVVNPSGMGLGDVKLSGVLGIALAWFGWAAWFVGTVTAFLLAAVVGIALLVTRRAHRRSPIPFGPFMVAGAFLGILTMPSMAGLAIGVGALG